VVVLALETPQRPHAVSGLAMPVAQGSDGLIVLRERSVFDAQGVLVDGAAREIVQKGSDDLPCCLAVRPINPASGLCAQTGRCVNTRAPRRRRAYRNRVGSSQTQQ